MSASTRRLRAGSLALAAVASGVLAAGLPTPAGAATLAEQRVEIPISSTSPQADVASSVVRLRVPLVPGAAMTTERCKWIAYERWRSVDGPVQATSADAVIVLFPGVLEGAAAFDQVARNTVRASAARGKHIEVWGIDRRANCMEDKTGLELAERTNNPDDAIDYYYKNKVIDGKRFPGWNQGNRVLADIGVQQTVEDYYSVLISELPSQPWREKHVICGGHSLGGPLTEIFGSWDFDGNKATTQDAGYRQCAGFVGLDTTLNGGVASPQSVPGNRDLLGQLTGGLLDQFGNIGVTALKQGLAPRHVDLLGISPQTMMFLELIALGADLEPDAEVTATVQNAPHTKSIDDFLKIGASYDLATYLAGSESLRNFRWTRMALLGQILDDNAGVFGIVRSSFGYPTGVPLRRNRLPEQVALIPGLGQLVTPDRLMLPQKTTPRKLQSWANYDQIGVNGVGLGITTPALEVADASQVARSIHEGPLNLTEDWFPIRLIIEQGLLASGDRTGSLAYSMHGSTMTKKPRVSVIAGNSVLTPRKVDPQVFAPGYQHLDVLMAAERQNNGQPEITSQTIANLVDQAVTG